MVSHFSSNYFLKTSVSGGRNLLFEKTYSNINNQRI